MTDNYGITYQQYRKKRLDEGLPARLIESKDHHRYIIYFGRQHVIDHENGNLSRGMMKIGKSVSPTSIMRNRNEGGGDFRIYAEIVLENENQLASAEDAIHKGLEHRHHKSTQGQKELFNIKDDELKIVVETCSQILKNFDYNVREHNIYLISNHVNNATP